MHYTNSTELEGNTIKYNDRVTFIVDDTSYEYKAFGNYLSGCGIENEKIFLVLDIDRHSLYDELIGEDSIESSQWPTGRNPGLEEVTIITMELFKIIEGRNTNSKHKQPKYTIWR